MKTLIKSALLALTLLAAFGAILFLTAEAAQAKSLDNPKVSSTAEPVAVRSAIFPSKSGDVVNVVVEQPAQQRLMVQLVDEAGRVLSTQITGRKPGAYHVRFHIEDLPTGKFQIVVLGKDAQNRHAFNIDQTQPVAPARQISVE